MEDAGSPRTSGSRTDRLYRQALDQQAKRAAKASEVDRECTFKPRLVSRRRPTSSAAAGSGAGGAKSDRYLKLYEQAKVTQERLKAARDGPSDAECTFSPALVAKSSRHTVRRGNVFDNLYKKAMDSEASKAERRRTEALKDCTFAPALNPPRKSRGVAPPAVPVAGAGAGAGAGRRASTGGKSRLYNPDWVRKRLDPESNDPDSRQLDECTFAPKLVAKKLTSHSDATRGRAVFDKLYSDASKIESKRQEAAMKKAMKEESSCTFSPDLALTKGALEPHNMGGGAAHDRLYRQAMDVWAKRSKKVDPADKGCTFKPKISDASKALSKNLRRTGGKDRFHEMYTEGLLRQKHRQSEAQNRSVEISKDDEDNCTFTPAITVFPSVSTQPQMPVHERLYANAFNRVQSRAADEDVDPVPVPAPAPAVDGSRRYVQGGELYLI